jgi:hypothetical protein
MNVRGNECSATVAGAEIPPKSCDLQVLGYSWRPPDERAKMYLPLQDFSPGFALELSGDDVSGVDLGRASRSRLVRPVSGVVPGVRDQQGEGVPFAVDQRPVDVPGWSARSCPRNSSREVRHAGRQA